METTLQVLSAELDYTLTTLKSYKPHQIKSLADFIQFCPSFLDRKNLFILKAVQWLYI